jgi:hypothetical protein
LYPPDNLVIGKLMRFKPRGLSLKKGTGFSAQLNEGTLGVKELLVSIKRTAFYNQRCEIMIA